MWVVSIFGIPKTISLGLSFLDIPFFFGNTFIQVMFASIYYTTIICFHFLYSIFFESHLVRSLTVCMSLSIWSSYSSEPTISKFTGLNAFYAASNSLSPTTISMLIWRAVTYNRVVFRPFSDLVAPRPCIFIINLNLILNDTVTRKMWPFKKMKHNPSYSFLWCSISRLGSGICDTLCTCCGIFWYFFTFRMATLGP